MNTRVVGRQVYVVVQVDEGTTDPEAAADEEIGSILEHGLGKQHGICLAWAVTVDPSRMNRADQEAGVELRWRKGEDPA